MVQLPEGFWLRQIGGWIRRLSDITKLQDSGHGDVSEGMRLLVRTEAGVKGPQVAQVLTVLGSATGSKGSEPRDDVPPKEVRSSDATEQETLGAVKWYDTAKGFGFIGPHRWLRDLIAEILTPLNEDRKLPS